MSITEQLPSIIAAVDEELGSGPKKRSVVLFDGKRLSATHESYQYHFEIPEGVFLGHVDDPEIIYQDSKVEGEILSVDNQFVTLSLTEDLGERVAQVAVEWATKLILQRLLDRLNKINTYGDTSDSSVASLLFRPTAEVAGEPKESAIFIDGLRNAPQRKAIAGAMVNKVSFVWGPPGTGKTSTLGFIAYNLIKTGQRVLFATNTNRAVDVAMQDVIGAYEHFGESFKGSITRYGPPFLRDDAALQSICFQNELQEVKEKLKEEIRDQYQLLHNYKSLHREVSEHSSYLRETSQAHKKVAEATAKLERLQGDLKRLEQQLSNRHGAGFLARLVSPAPSL